MLLCSIADLEPGMVVGASLLHPARPEMELLASGTKLTTKMIAQLKRLEVTNVWVDVSGTEELDGQMAISMTMSQQRVYVQLKKTFSSTSRQTINAANIKDFRQTVMNLVTESVAGAMYAGLAYRMHTTEGPMFAHSASVAYLSVTIGHALKSYIIRERPRLPPKEAGDLVALGLGAMLHDVGKLTIPEAVRGIHECTCQPRELPEGYSDHTVRGFKILSAARAPAAARQAVLMHHQRWDGTGWPTIKDMGLRPDSKPLAGRNLHIFCRIIAAANVLDSLLQPTISPTKRRPAVEALHRIASHEFDGWFDPLVRRAMLETIPPFSIGERVTLSNGKPAAIVAPNREHPCFPTVRPLTDNPDFRTEQLSPTGEIRIQRSAGIDVSQFLYEVPPMPTEDVLNELPEVPAAAHDAGEGRSRKAA